jgi:hypothetical protein
MYKILDTDSNTHVIFESYTDACAFKGINPKAAYKVKRNTKDRPKHFNSVTLINFAVENNIKSYVRDWLILNNLRA